MDTHHQDRDLHPTEQVSHEVPPASKSFMTFMVLAGLAVLALVVGFSNLGDWKVVASLAVAGTQAIVLSLFFMDLRQADKITWLIAAGGVFWVFLMFLFTLTDYLTRYMGAL